MNLYARIKQKIPITVYYVRITGIFYDSVKNNFIETYFYNHKPFNKKFQFKIKKTLTSDLFTKRMLVVNDGD
jgi:hypothetical protein